MNDPNAFTYQEGGAGGTAPSPGRPAMGPNAMAQYKFSAEELRVLQECNRDSFFQRSLPLSTLFGFGAYAGVQSGRLRPNPRFGAMPKVAAAIAVGYFLGKLSYQQACAEKLMALPGSYIGQLLRDRRDGKIDGRTLPPTPSTLLGAPQADVYSDAGPGSALDLDTDRPTFNDDMYRPDSSGPIGGVAEPPPPALSYDDLRRQNRGQYNNQDPYRVDPGLGAPPPAPRRAAPPRPAAPPTNQYGDALE